MVVATADIQNWKKKKVTKGRKILPILTNAHLNAYLHDDEEEECDEDVDLRVSPGVVVADVVKLLGDSLAAPRAVVKQSDQGLVLRQLTC